MRLGVVIGPGGGMIGRLQLPFQLGLGARLGTGYVSAEVLHQAEPTSPLTLVVSAGRHQGVTPLSPVVAPGGLVGVIGTVDAQTSTVLTWAHPDFRASAMAADGSVYGIVGPLGAAAAPGVWVLGLQGVPYRQVVADGTPIVTSGLGGVFPRGIPIGTVVGVAGEAGGWERTYRVRPGVHPAAASHVLILGTGRPLRCATRRARTAGSRRSPLRGAAAGPARAS